jgi:hypothetical protein
MTQEQFAKTCRSFGMSIASPNAFGLFINGYDISAFLTQQKSCYVLVTESESNKVLFSQIRIADENGLKIALEKVNKTYGGGDDPQDN